MRLKEVYMHVVIIGCGRVGARLASLLSSSGHSVAVIDRDARAFQRLGRSFKGTTLRGIGFDRKLLLEAGIEQADALVAVTNGDNSNVVVASIAVDDFHVPRVVARIADPARAEIFAKWGITTLSATLWAAARIYELIISPELCNVLSVGSAGVQLYEFEVPNLLVGRMVSDLAVTGEITVVAITRRGVGFIPMLGTTFELRDRALVAADTRSITKLQSMLGLSG
jgi:trk system potassium uptake protein TrkA